MRLLVGLLSSSIFVVEVIKLVSVSWVFLLLESVLVGCLSCGLVNMNVFSRLCRFCLLVFGVVCWMFF